MRARRVMQDKEVFADGTIREISVWVVPAPVPGSTHQFKYRLFFGRPGERLVGYDNERGKGDHVHRGGAEHAYRFVDLETLLRDFLDDVADWRQTQ